MGSTSVNDVLGGLRRSVASIEGSTAFSLDEGAAARLGVAAVDRALAGGLAYGALHDIASATPGQPGAALGFALAAAALAAAQAPAGRRHVLWIQTDYGAQESGLPYGLGVDLFGLPMDRLLLLRVPRPLDVLWAFEEALKPRALAAVVAELPEAGEIADLTATRRLTLAARAGGTLAALVNHRASKLPKVAMTRWEVAGAPSVPDRFGGLGRPTFDLSLTRNRRGPSGRWIVSWDHDERTFVPALPVGLAETAGDRPADARPLPRAG